MVINKSYIDFGMSRFRIRDIDRINKFFKCPNCKEFTLEINPDAFKMAKEIKQSSDFKKMDHYSKKMKRILKGKSFSKKALEEIKKGLLIEKEYEEWEKKDFKIFAEKIKKIEVVKNYMNNTKLFPNDLFSYIIDDYLRFSSVEMELPASLPDILKPEKTIYYIDKFFNDDYINTSFRNSITIRENITNIRNYISVINGLCKKDGEIVKFGGFENYFHISHSENICKCCNTEFEKCTTQENAIGVFFKKATIKEKEDNILVNIVFDQINQYKKHETNKISSYKEYLSVLFCFNTKTGQSYMIRPAVLGKKRKEIDIPIKNITFSGNSYKLLFCPDYISLEEDIPKEVILEIFTKIREKRNDIFEKEKEKLVDDMRMLCLYNRHPMFVSSNVKTINNSLHASYFSKLYRGYFPSDNSFSFLKDFKNKKAVKKEITKDFRKAVFLDIFKVKDVNNALKILKNESFGNIVDEVIWRLNKKQIRLFMNDSFKVSGETTTINKMFCHSFSLDILKDSINLYHEYKKYLKIDCSKKEQLREIKSLFTGRNLKEIHDELSIRIGKMKHTNREIKYKETLIDGIFGEIYFKYPRETLEIVTCGNIMHICVGGEYYIKSVLKRESDIVIGYNKNNSPVICIEIEKTKGKDQIVQVKGIRNSMISHENLSSFNMWMNSMNNNKKTTSNTFDMQLKASWNKLDESNQKSFDEINEICEKRIRDVNQQAVNGNPF